LHGAKTPRTFIRLPIVRPTVTMVIGMDATDHPYGEIIDLGQRRMADPASVRRILNMSGMGGFAYIDTPKNGLVALVNARKRDETTTAGLARKIGTFRWSKRKRSRAKRGPLDEGTAMAKAVAVTRRRLRAVSPMSTTLLAAADAAPGCGSRRRSIGPVCGAASSASPTTHRMRRPSMQRVWAHALRPTATPSRRTPLQNHSLRLRRCAGCAMGA
jgi:hypothetical protein